MDIIGTFEAIKTFLREESDTVLGLIFFNLIGLAIIKYLLESILKNAGIPISYAGLAIVIVITILWAIKRKIPITPEKFTIAIAPFELLMLNVKTEVNWEAKRDLRKNLIDYIYSALHFNKEKLYLDKYLQIIRLPNRIKTKQKNVGDITKSLNVDLLIWGETYYDGTNLHLKPKFEFLREPSNAYYAKFKRSLNEIKSFKINIQKSVEKKDSELTDLMHYLSFLGLMFHGISQSHEKKFEDAKDIFNTALEVMHKSAFHNKTLTDIYLATRFFAAQNIHHWGSYILEHDHDNQKAQELYTASAKMFFNRAKEIGSKKGIDAEERIEHSILYGIYLMAKKGNAGKAEKKLESFHKQFNKDNIYLYYLYKGILQKNTKTAQRYFDKAVKKSRNDKLVYEKIADYFFAKGKSKLSIEYFNKRFKSGDQKLYNPDLLANEAHEKLSHAYLKEMKLIAALKQKMIAMKDEGKNKEKDDYLSE